VQVVLVEMLPGEEIPRGDEQSSEEKNGGFMGDFDLEP
jgi:hypothetical protein